MGQKLGAVPLLGGAGSPSKTMRLGLRPTSMPSNTMLPGPRSTSLTSDILIHPATIHQCYRQTDRQTGQRSDSTGQTVLKIVAQKSGQDIFRNSEASLAKCPSRNDQRLAKMSARIKCRLSNLSYTSIRQNSKPILTE